MGENRHIRKVITARPTTERPASTNNVIGGDPG